MKLLITTQVMDKNHPILGFFHRWVEEFASHFAEVHVICLQKGACDLPANVYIYSLGKESGVSRLTYVYRFYKYIWKLRNSYDIVFSHMNPHYVVLGGLFWRLNSKQIFFWRNHAKMDKKTYVAAQFAKNVFYTSPYACTSRFKHAVKMPVGIDTNLFYPRDVSERQDKTILFLGRLSRVKRPEKFIEMGKYLTEYGLHIYGNGLDTKQKYESLLKSSAGENITFYDSVTNTQASEIYNKYEIYMNLTPEGSMDKTILEAAACGTLIMVTNKAFENILPSECLIVDENPEAIAKQVKALHDLSSEQKQKYASDLRQLVVSEHSLKKLVAEFIQKI